MAIDESQFRRQLVSELKKVLPCCEYLSSMNRSGVPDVHAIVDGRAHWLELKFTDKWPVRGPSNVLDHRFTPPQLSFMRRVERAGGRGYGVIGYRINDSRKTMVAALAVSDINDNGTVTRDQLQSALALDLSDKLFAWAFAEMLARS